jgi:diguanylate cyclase (GGDEF)-like protein
VDTGIEIEHTLAKHAREHEAVARLGQIALREHELEVLIDRVVATVIDTLGLQLCGVSRLREDEQALDIVLSVGQPDPPRVLPGGRETQAGYALHTGAPVISEDLRAEKRFNAGYLLSKGMLSGMSAIIEGRERPYGVLSAHTREARRFGPDDVNFLVAVANVLSAAVERTRKEEAARHAALHDPLTGLPNRTLALDHLELALARRRRRVGTVALLLLDLDRFTPVNDTLGHRAGDHVLTTIAARLRETLRASDTAARISADEFAVICESDGDVHDVVELAARVGAAVAQPLAVGGAEHVLTASIGIAIAESPADTAATMLCDAEAAMYRAKHRGGGHYELFDAAMRAQVHARLRTESELRRAISEGQLCLHYQPILDAVGQRPLGLEALVRWQHPERGLIGPLEFIPIAEETGMIAALGRHVAERACAQAATWQRRFATPLQMFVNVSALQLGEPSFAEELAAIARRSGIAPGTLGLEVTESVLIEDARAATTVLGDLHERGLRLMLDDFGTGYSSLSYLRTFPLHGVKIDRSFLEGLATGKRDDEAIIRAIVEMCHALKLATVAEGIETDTQLARIRALGCEYVQGFLLSRPLASSDAVAYLDAQLRPGVETHLGTGARRPRD